MIRRYEGKKGVRWHVVVYTGRGRRVFGGAFATQKAAKRAEAVLLLSQHSPDAKSAFSVSLEAHLRTLEQTIGRRTLAGYESIARNYLKPYF